MHWCVIFKSENSEITHPGVGDWGWVSSFWFSMVLGIILRASDMDGKWANILPFSYISAQKLSTTANVHSFNIID